MDDYTQKVLWVGTVLGDSTIQEFEEFFLKTLGYNVKYNEEFEMIGEFVGSHCIIFSIHHKDIPKFSLFRITTPDMKWFEDWIDNHKDTIPKEILLKYNTYLN